MSTVNQARVAMRGVRVRVLGISILCALAGLRSAAAGEVMPATEDPNAAPSPVSPAAPAAPDAPSELDGVSVSAKTSTRSAVSLSGVEIQKIQPGASPLKAIETLPGVLYQTADPWGNNEQNTSLFVHGFSTQQLGYTLDGVPLGDQQYGNYNGLSPQRAIISEDVGAVVLSSGAGAVGTASTSNLGGTIETHSSDPSTTSGLRFAQTFGSYDTYRTYLRYDTGTFAGDNSAYISVVHQDQQAWDFDGHQRGWQADGKFVHDDDNGKLTLYAAYSDKAEPNEDAIYYGPANAGLTIPYTRPFMYPNWNYALGYLGINGATPKAAGNNYRNYFSGAFRTDYLSYAKYEWKLSDSLTWTNQIYYHHNDGYGIVSGPISAAGLPLLFSTYFPNQNLQAVFGGSGYASRTTEYDINRRGMLSSLDWQMGSNQLDAGIWYEHNRSSAIRNWYPDDVNNPPDLYDRPSNPLITQYNSQISNHVFQPYLEDQYHLTPDITLQGGFKSSLQFAKGWFPVQPLPGSTAGVDKTSGFPNGTINTKKWFLPQLGALWDITPADQLFLNIQQNMRQFITYGAGGLSPWSLGSQQAFNIFKRTVQPETAWTYELGWRTQHEFDAGPISSIDAQISAYHVDFSNRLLSIAPTPIVNAIVGGAAIIENVGSVTTNGMDVALTLHFGEHFSFYNALSYNSSKYQDNYTSGTSIVPTAGKQVPGSPQWLDKSILSADFGLFSTQLIGDYVGKRYATYTNDLSVPGYFLLGLQAQWKLPMWEGSFLHDPKIAFNISNLLDRKGIYEVQVGAASGTFNAYRMSPTQAFVTFSGRF
jgi:hypothetical protein